MARSSTRPTPVADELAPLVRAVLGPDPRIAVRAWDGSRIGPPDASVTIELHSAVALQHLLWSPGELGLARAHVSGALDVDGDVFDLLALRSQLGRPDEDVSLRLTRRERLRLLGTLRRLGLLGRRPPIPDEESRPHGQLHTRRRDAEAIAHHYDVSNDFYRLVLGPSMTYSCAYWYEDGLTLEAAQEAKYELISRKLGLGPGMRLLDVGCGWGSMAMHAALHHGAKVVGITISEAQAQLAQARVDAAGLARQVEIRIQDYRDITDGPFDAISSIGMFEHVGEDQMAEYLVDLHALVRPGGRVLNHAISRPNPDDRSGVSPRSFMGRYVFPDAALLEVGTVVSAMQRVGLEVRDVHSLREHYTLTLRAWVTNLEGAWDEAQRLVGPGRARVWRLYLAGCAIGFEENRTAIHQVLAVRTREDGAAGVPATRSTFEVDHDHPVDR
ncbi:MAG TPA: cyclopropane-fatty-acyl-phospholipid synthase family protein [Acidimicrobiales bacterium]|nr:cyclopropane-fatty-acyl-phospholipid synthase family protein [Acidimicrobiales bacterium]